MNNKEKMTVNAIFKYKNNTYVLLLNDKCQRFFLKFENDKLDYITIEEYKDINQVLFSLKPLVGYRMFEIEPLIRIKDKLVTLTVAASILITLSGCVKGIEKTTEELNKLGIETVIVSAENDIHKITKVNLDKKTTYNNADFSGFSNTPFSVICTPGTFGNYIGTQNVTFEDLKTTVKSNNNIPDDIKTIINEGIDNLEIANFNMNYSALKYNLEKLRVEYVEPQEINYVNGIFDTFAATAKINKEIDKTQLKEVLIHEIIGHGSTRAYDKEKEILCDVGSLYLSIDENGGLTDVHNYGAFGMEGIADVITSIANNKKIKTSYTTHVYELTTLCSSVGISIEDYANYGVEYLTEKMLEQGIDNPYQVITTLDNTALLLEQNALIQSNSTDLIMYYYQELSEGNLNMDTLRKSTIAYSDYVETQKVGDQNVIIYAIDEDTFDLIQPDMVTDYVHNLEK